MLEGASAELTAGQQHAPAAPTLAQRWRPACLGAAGGRKFVMASVADVECCTGLDASDAAKFSQHLVVWLQDGAALSGVAEAGAWVCTTARQFADGGVRRRCALSRR